MSIHCDWNDCTAEPIKHAVFNLTDSIKSFLHTDEDFLGICHINLCADHLMLFRVMIRDAAILSIGECGQHADRN